LIQEYDFTLHHIPSKINSKANILPRRPGFEEGIDDNNDLILLPDTLFSTQTNTLLVQEITMNIDGSVKKALERKDKNYSLME
jgi:hypothetical protein